MAPKGELQMARAQTQAADLAKRTFDLTTCTHMWHKLEWEVRLLEQVSSAPVREPAALAFCAVNVCITATSLVDRVWADLSRSGSPSPASTKADFRAWVRAQIPLQEACETIANTTKHGGVDLNSWKGGVARIAPVVPKRLHRKAHEPYDPNWMSKATPGEIAWAISITFDTKDGWFGGVGTIVFHDVVRGWEKIIKGLNLWSLTPTWSQPPASVS